MAACKSCCDKLVVAAIDFGTTYSGYAFSFKHDYEKEPTKVPLEFTDWIIFAPTLITEVCLFFFRLNKIESKMAASKSCCDKLVVAAIDFGTTYSGYAFSFKHDYEKERTKVPLEFTDWIIFVPTLIPEVFFVFFQVE